MPECINSDYNRLMNERRYGTLPDMKRKRMTAPAADIASEQIRLSPATDGIDGITAISHGFYRTNWEALPEHTHKGCIELCFCSRGSLVFECNGRKETLLPNNVFLTQPTDLHHLVTNHKGMRMYWLFFKYPAKGRTVLGLSAAETSALVKRLRAIVAHVFSVSLSMRQLFRDIFRAYETIGRGTYRTIVLRTLLLKILLETIDSANNRPTLKALAKISQIAKLISGRPAHRFTIAEMAAHAKLSESRFTALFRQVIGLPPYAYLTTRRLEKAKSLLATSKKSIGEIAHELKFSSAQHLATQFRKTYGLTATEWRSRLTVPPSRTRSREPQDISAPSSRSSRGGCRS